MELFQVTLKKGEDIQAFYDDMETPGGALHIPDRQVECTHRRPTSRTTGYMLTMEEAQEVAADDRVEQVMPQSVLDRVQTVEHSVFTGRFDKSPTATGAQVFTKSDGNNGINYSVSHRMWGILRHIESTNRSNWGSDAASASDRYVDDSVTYSASGKNVDIVIVENHTWYDHADFADRIVDYNWGQHYNAITGGTNYTYSLDLARASRVAEVDSHPTAVCSFAAGTLYGLANDANVYCFSQAAEPLLSGGDTTRRTFAYIREFHRTKPINPATGRKNPTIVNVSLGSYNNMSGVAYSSFQGVDIDKGNGGDLLSEAELASIGINSGQDSYVSNTDFRVNSADIDSDQVDAIDEGIIVVTSAGNGNRYIDESGGDHYDDYIVPSGGEYTNKDYEFPFGSGIFPFRYYYNRGSYFTHSGAITVGALSNHTDQGKATFSEFGPGVDVYAAGETVIGASDNSSIAFGIPYPGQESNVGTWDTIGFGQGTSYSAPFITGLLACLAEVYPTLTQAQARAYLRDNAITGLMQDTGSSTTDWSPTDAEIAANATNAAWFDASDTSSYTLSGSNVTALTDKKGNATVTVTGTPNVSNTLDSKNVFTFSGSEDFTTDEFAQVDSAGNHWAIGLMQWNSRDDSQDSLWSVECNTQTPKRDYAISAGASGFAGEVDLDGLSSNRISSTIGNKQDFDNPIPQNTWVIVCAIFNKTGNQIAFRVNGADAFTPVNDYDNALNTNLDLRFFRNRANERMGGRMAEFLTFAGLPGTGGTDISHVERIEGYLAHKWGQASSLPVSHAYKNSAPLQNGLLVNSNTRVSIDGSDIDRITLWKNHRATSGNMAFNTYNANVNDRPTSGLMYPRKNTRIHKHTESSGGGGGAVWYGNRGLIGGGNPSGSNSVNSISYFDISALGNAQDFGDLTVSREVLSATSDGTYALWFTGAINNISTSSNVIDYVTTATIGNATDFGDVTTARRLTGGNGALSDGTYGLLGGGRTYGAGGSNYNIIDYVTIASPGNAQDFGDLTTSRLGTSGVSDGTYGVWAGGQGASDENTMDYVTVATTGNAQDFGDLTVARYEHGAASDSTRGVWAGGQGSGVSQNVIDYATIASPGNATDFGDMSAATKTTGASNGTRAVFYHSYQTTIDYVTIQTTGNAADFGDNNASVGQSGATSGSDS